MLKLVLKRRQGPLLREHLVEEPEVQAIKAGCLSLVGIHASWQAKQIMSFSITGTVGKTYLANSQRERASLQQLLPQEWSHRPRIVKCHSLI